MGTVLLTIVGPLLMGLVKHLQRSILRKICRSKLLTCEPRGHVLAIRASHCKPRSSALFISNAVAQHTAAVQVELNLEERYFDGLEALRRSVLARHINYDVDSLMEDYRELRALGARKEQLTQEREAISDMMKALIKAESYHNEATWHHPAKLSSCCLFEATGTRHPPATHTFPIKKKKTDDIENSKKILIQRGKEVRETLKAQMPGWWQLEEKVMLAALRLPNDLHSSTPIDEPVVLKGSPHLEDCVSSECRPDHVEIGKKLGVLKFTNVGPTAYYLQGELAHLERALISSVTQVLRQQNFIHITCPEILRTAVLEACGHDIHNPREVYTLTYKSDDEQKHEKIENSYHLEGLSLASFSAYLSKMLIETSSLPLKYSAIGRHYSPSGDITLPGLYGARQSLRSHIFTGCADSYQCYEVKGHMEELLWDIHSDLDLPIRLVQVPAHSLHLNEQSRTEVQVWSADLQHFIQVAYIAVVGDYVSQKLKIRHVETVHSKTGREHLHMVHGCAMNVTRLLAAFLEKTPSQGKETIDIPEKLMSHHLR